LFLLREKTDRIDKEYNLEKDGYYLFKNLFNTSEINYLKEKSKSSDYQEIKNFLLNNQKFKDSLYKVIDDKNYIFQDYVLIIKKSLVHTCHRDYNGDVFNKKQKHPSYTILVYLEDMGKCLGVVPTSHTDGNSFNINIIDPTVIVPCQAGDALLFNASLIHTGVINKNNNNLRIQLKFTHKEDIPTLSYFQNYNKIINSENKLPTSLSKAQQKLSCLLPAIAKLNNNSVKEGDIPFYQKVFSFLFYGDSKFYELKNAF
jgi:hypothetical protein